MMRGVAWPKDGAASSLSLRSGRPCAPRQSLPPRHTSSPFRRAHARTRHHAVRTHSPVVLYSPPFARPRDRPLRWRCGKLVSIASIRIGPSSGRADTRGMALDCVLQALSAASRPLAPVPSAATGQMDARAIIRRNKRKRDLEERGIDSSVVDEMPDEHCNVHCPCPCPCRSSQLAARRSQPASVEALSRLCSADFDFARSFVATKSRHALVSRLLREGRSGPRQGQGQGQGQGARGGEGRPRIMGYTHDQPDNRQAG